MKYHKNYLLTFLSKILNFSNKQYAILMKDNE
jgi:hypothetical protein